jgi:hypothetical protein
MDKRFKSMGKRYLSAEIKIFTDYHCPVYQYRENTSGFYEKAKKKQAACGFGGKGFWLY